MPVEDRLERLANGRHLGVVESALLEDGCVARRHQQLVAVAQRHLEPVRQLEDHAGAGARPARLDEAQVPCRDAGVERQVELAEAPPLAPVAQQRPYASGCSGARHGGDLSAAGGRGDYP